MKKLLFAALLSSAWMFAAAQAQPPTVSVSAKGDDVRLVLSNLFEQSKKSFILEPNIRFALFLSLNEVDFDEALELVCKTANLKYEVQNGIYFVTRAPAKSAPKPEVKPDPKAQGTPVTKPETKPLVKSEPKKNDVKALPKPEHNGETKVLSNKAPESPTLPKTVLDRKVTTRLEKVEIRTLFADLGRQARVTIELDKSVPNYRFDAFLDNATLGFALENIAKAADLEIQFTNRRTIALVPKKSTGKNAN
jgi:hypothetical protein